MNLMMFASSLRAVNCVQAIVQEGHTVSAMIMESSKKEDVLVAEAKRHNIPIHFLDSLKEIQPILDHYNPDLGIICVYEKILPKQTLDFFRARKGIINLHAGKLPEYRGSGTLRWQIISGNSRGAFTILGVDEDLDTSDIYNEFEYDIGPNMSVKDIIEIEHVEFPKLLVETINKIESNALSLKKQDGKACYWHKRLEKDREINFSKMSAQQIHDLIRAETRPYSGAYAIKDDKKIQLWSSSLETDQIYKGTPGRIVKKSSEGVVIICKDVGILIKQASLDSQPINAKDVFLYGDQLQ